MFLIQDHPGGEMFGEADMSMDQQKKILEVDVKVKVWRWS